MKRVAGTAHSRAVQLSQVPECLPGVEGNEEYFPTRPQDNTFLHMVLQE